MTPKEKAKTLYSQFSPIVASFGSLQNWHKNTKQCALIAVEEIINALNYFCYANTMYDDFETGKITFIDDKLPETYWNMVKQEIEKL